MRRSDEPDSPLFVRDESGDSFTDSIIATRDFDAVIALKEPNHIHIWGSGAIEPDLLADALESIAHDLREMKRDGTI